MAEPAWPAEPTRRRPTYERIRDAIVDGRIEPGTKLVESTVAEWCGVSRTPVREALTRLEQDGLVERSDSGLVVRERSPEEILDLYETRIVLEVVAARVAAERHTSFDRIRLEQLQRAWEQCDPHDGVLLAQRNREFHRGVWLASHNETLLDLLHRLNLHLVRYPATTLSYPGRFEEAAREHAELVEAIARRDVEAAGAITEKHFSRARDIRLELWQQDRV